MGGNELLENEVFDNEVLENDYVEVKFNLEDDNGDISVTKFLNQDYGVANYLINENDLMDNEVLENGKKKKKAKNGKKKKHKDDYDPHEVIVHF